MQKDWQSKIVCEEQVVLKHPHAELISLAICNSEIFIFFHKLSVHKHLYWLIMLWIIIHSASADASADLSADMPEKRLIKLEILLKHSRML